jgi:hypothetical protein
LDTYLKQAVARALAKVIDGNEAILIVEEASDRRFLENLVYLIRDRYQGESMKILRRLEEALEIRDPTLAEKLRRVYRR